MPGTLKYTPSWLSRPSPGFDLFTPKSQPQLAQDQTKQNNKPFGPARTIARRGTEIFVATGNELRWSDLVLLKEQWEEGYNKKNGDTGDHDREESQSTTRVSFHYPSNRNKRLLKKRMQLLKVPVSRRIRQLIISPNGDYLAIATSHTIHVAMLPDSSHLASEDTSPLKLKTFHVGPTTHVLERSPIASALWHPLGASGVCLVTVTVDAVVRLWELDKDNRWSFDSPALAVDLIKLVNGSSSNEDFLPSKYGANKTFSPDAFEMEVAAACFGGSTAEGEDPWASMTLWIAMQEGDVYALSPFLPSKWMAPRSMIARLTASISCVSSSDCETDHSQQTRNQMRMWLSDISSQQSGLTNEELVSDVYILQRPLRPNPISKLQGPFAFSPEMDDVFELTDIYAIASIENEDAALSEDGEIEDEDLGPASAGLLCLLTSDSKVHILANIGTVEGRWLPPRKMHTDDADEEVELLLLESLSLGEAADGIYPSFTTDPQSQHSVFVTHSTGVSHLDLSSWSTKLADEFTSEDDAGLSFRVDTLLETASTTLSHPITFSTPANSYSPVACIALTDSDLGFFVLTTNADQPYAATLEEPLSTTFSSLRITGLEPSLLLEYNPLESDSNLDTIPDARATYQPPQVLYAPSSLPSFLDTHAHPRVRRTLADELRLSPAVLQLMLDAHRVLSSETHRLGLAVAELFRRCERLQEEFREQLRRVRECRDRIDTVVEEGADDYRNMQGEQAEADGGVREAVEMRLEKVRERQENLEERHAEIRRKIAKAGGRPMSEKEDQWITEIRVMKRMVRSKEIDTLTSDEARQDGTKEDGDTSLDVDSDALPHARYDQVRQLQKELVDQAQEVEQNAAPREQEDFTASTSSLRSSIRGGGSVQRRREAQAEIEMLLERQTALLEATREKIGRLAGLGYSMS